MSLPDARHLLLAASALLLAGLAASAGTGRAGDPADSTPATPASTPELAATPTPAVAAPSSSAAPDATPAGAAVEAGTAVPPAQPPAPAEPDAAPAVPAPVEAVQASAGTPLPPLGLAHLDLARGRWVAPIGDAEAVLTLDPTLQARLERQLSSWNMPWGVVVMLEPASGRVLALAEHSRAQPGRRDLALTPLSPAASIFKLVTAAALLEAGIDPEATVCYHGGRHRLQPGLLEDDPRRDRRCASLNTAFGRSTNAVFAKLADRGLDAEALRAAAERFLFNGAIPFERPVEPSPALIGDEPFEVAQAAAGFGQVRMSALHGALLAALVANRGMLVPPRLVDDLAGGVLPPGPAPWRVVDEGVAARLAEMMQATVTQGTAHRALGSHVPRVLRGVAIAGKTGSLAERDPYRDHSWFVGYAGTPAPEVALAVDVVNDRLWRVRATQLAREALEIYYGARVSEAGSAGPTRMAAR